jgi:3-methyladenine DNA glycosylase AlkC
MNPKSHKILPKSDRNERLERLSSQALEAVLPVEKFLSREDKPDKGVDSSIEVIDDN